MAAKKVSNMTDAQFGAALRSQVMDSILKDVNSIVQDYVDNEGMDTIYDEMYRIVGQVVKGKNFKDTCEKRVQEALNDETFLKQLVIDTVRRR